MIRNLIKKIIFKLYKPILSKLTILDQQLINATKNIQEANNIKSEQSILLNNIENEIYKNKVEISNIIKIELEENIKKYNQEIKNSINEIIFEQIKGIYSKYMFNYCNSMKESILSLGCSIQGLIAMPNYEEELLETILKMKSQSGELNLYDDISKCELLNYLDKKNNIVIGNTMPLIINNNDIEKKIKKGINPIEMYSKLNNVYNLDVDLIHNENILITNTHFANMLILSKGLLQNIATIVSNSIIMPFCIPTKPVTIVWMDGFGLWEKNDKFNFRWADSQSGIAILKIINSTEKNMDITFEWTSWILTDKKAKVMINATNFNEILDIHNNKKFSIKLIIPPGRSNIEFQFIGECIKPSGDERYLNFSINDFTAINNENDTIINGDEAYYLDYSNSKHIDNFYVGDYFIRKQLHKNGFYEVYGTAYFNHGFFSMPLSVTRYLHRDSFYVYKQNLDVFSEAENKGIDFITVIYVAKRCCGISEG